MKRLLTLYVALIAVFGLLFLQSCSAESEITTFDQARTMEFNRVNLEKKWLTTFYAFTPDCPARIRTSLQLSSVEINLKDSHFSLLDRYSLIEDKGTYKFDGDEITLHSSSDEVLKLLIKTFNSEELILEVLDHPYLKEIELINIK
ncbi:hypothetical protein [Myroides phaeus]|uniref:Lipocalin-like domain-containing protein n=1 Tax=Myroides phaeus TaxID=702745 RepID=A0A1G8CHW6_9FLAO|nr:hypothetical protein [Myroides phaeus]SDH45002.1 hypothetical protein SAMN05421818_10458 [Myroides phaeus]